MPLITTRFQKMWTSFKQSVPNLGEERIYLTRFVSVLVLMMNDHLLFHRAGFEFRWKQCVALVNEGFGLVAAHLYVTKMASNWTNTWVFIQLERNFLFLFCLVFHLQSAAKQTVDIASDRRTERSFRRKHRSPRVDRRRDDVAPSGESKLVSNLV
jgi:hypothetical protein